MDNETKGKETARVDVDPKKLMETIQIQHLEDDEPLDTSGSHLINHYNNGSVDFQAGVDAALIALTGWSMETLAKITNGEEV